MKWNEQNNWFDRYSYHEADSTRLTRLSIHRLSFDNLNHPSISITVSESVDSVLQVSFTPDFRIDLKYLAKIQTDSEYLIKYSSGFRFDLLVSPTGRTWMISNTGNFLLDGHTHEFQKHPGFIPDSEMDGLNPGLKSSMIHSQKWFSQNQQNFDQNLYPAFQFTETCFCDRQGISWLVLKSANMEGTGISRSIRTPDWFKHYFSNLNKNGTDDIFFTVVKDRNGILWAAPKTGGVLYSYRNSTMHQTKLPEYELIDRIGSYPRSMLPDSTGIWIGYYKKQLLFYDFSSGNCTVEFLNKAPAEDNSNPQGLIHLVKDGENLLIFAFNGIYRFDPKSKTTKPLWLTTDQEQVYSFTSDLNGGWYVGLVSSVKHLNAEFMVTRTLKVDDSKSNVESLCLGDKNDLYAALLGGGLARIDLTTEESEIFTTAHGLSNNTCYSILKDRKGNFWISTNKGISKFNPQTKKFRIFGQEEGLKISEFNSDAVFLSPDGQMFFGGVGGIVGFHPDSIYDQVSKEPPAPFHITDFKVSGIPRYFERAIYETDTITLNRGDNNFQVNFACLDFQNAEKIRYRYRLSGENSKWTETGWRHRFVNYANLSPGSYLLDIEATDRNGDWVSQTSLLVVIPPFYYQTLWFRLLVLIVLTVLLASLVINYNKRIRLKARQDQDQLKLESLRGQMNPHFIFNSLNSINYFIAKNDRLSANRYIADFSRLIRTILGNLSKEYVPFPKELESLEDYLKLEHLRFGDKFNYTVELPQDKDLQEIQVFPGMVQPFVENAIWHGVRGLEGRKGLICIYFSWNGSSLTCRVEDDGIGRKLAEERKSDLPGKTSRGIGIVLERLRIINRLKKTNHQILIEDLYPEKEETGTRVIIEIPVKT